VFAGGGATTVRPTFVVALCEAASLSVTCSEKFPGCKVVPEIAPDVESRTSPEGRDPTDHV